MADRPLPRAGGRGRATSTPSGRVPLGARLVVRAGGRTHVFGPDQVATIGRQGDVHIGDDRVSRQHAMVSFEGGVGWVLADLGSTHGTYHGRAPVRRLVVDGPTEVVLGDPRHGATVRLGPVAPEAVPAATAGARPRPDDSWYAPTSTVRVAPATTRAPTDGGTPAGVGRRPAPGGRAPARATEPPPAPGVAPAPARPDMASSPTGIHRTVRRPGAAPAATRIREPVPAAGPAAGTARSVVRIGRAERNDVVITDLAVSRRHAELRDHGGWWELVDLGSQNGTYLDGARVDRARLRDGQVVEIGDTRLRFAGGRLVTPGADRTVLDVDGLVVHGRGRRGGEVLDGVSCTVRAGELVAVVGPNGSGRAALLRVLTGQQPADAGVVRVAGRPLTDGSGRRPRVGAVPADDVLHPQLTVRRALRYAARLRLPGDTPPEVRRQRVDRVLDQVGLTDEQARRVGDLPVEGRIRATIAAELLAEPAVLVLDEPTAGLDPGSEKAVMQLLRRLASGRRAVVIVTNDIAGAHRCDRVLLLGRGGVVAYDGDPLEASAHFGREELADVIRDLEVRHVRAAPAPPRPRPPADGGAPPGPPRVGWARQVATLVQRQAAVLAADRRRLAFAVAAVLGPAALILLLVPPGSLGPGGSAATLLGGLVLAATAVGVANGAREVVGEAPGQRWERGAGVRPSAYLVAKALFLGGLTAVQVTVLSLVATADAGGPATSVLLDPPRLELVAVLVLTGIAALALGLAVSALVPSTEAALTAVPVVLVVQWLLSGVAVPTTDQPVLRVPSVVAGASWGMAAAAASVDLAGLEGTCGSTPTGDGTTAEPACDPRWRHGTRPWVQATGALGALAVAGLVVAGDALAEPFRPGRRRVAVRFPRSRDG